MQKILLSIRTKIEEVPSIGTFIIDAMTGDVIDFIAFSSLYDDPFLTDLELERKAIEALVNPTKLNGELKVITGNIYSNQDLLTTNINYLEGYIKRAKGLTIGAKDFGIKAVRVCNRSGDIEGLVSKIDIVTKNASDVINMAALTAVGFSVAKLKTITDLRAALKKGNDDQNSKINQRIILVGNNHAAINSFWAKLVDVCDAGKRIFKPISEEKKQQYVVSKLLSRMRKDAAKTGITGLVEPKARIEFKSLTGGRKRVTYANTKGEFDQKGIKAGEYLATKIVKGKPNVSKNVVIETGKSIVENFWLNTRQGGKRNTRHRGNEA